jgi:hypothetical protein
MEPFRIPPHVPAIVVATLLLFIAGFVVSSLATRDSHRVAPTAQFIP